MKIQGQEIEVVEKYHQACNSIIIKEGKREFQLYVEFEEEYEGEFCELCLCGEEEETDDGIVLVRRGLEKVLDTIEDEKGVCIKANSPLGKKLLGKLVKKCGTYLCLTCWYDQFD